jgi:hypothetical protein
LTTPFDVATIDQLLFLDTITGRSLQLQGQGILTFMRLIAAGLADFRFTNRNMSIEFYEIAPTERGKSLVDAWKSGQRERVSEVLATCPARTKGQV